MPRGCLRDTCPEAKGGCIKAPEGGIFSLRDGKSGDCVVAVRPNVGTGLFVS